ncbi:MAG: hypothetical protein ABUR63_01020, partial [Verrucomicrobiota bacterium]
MALLAAVSALSGGSLPAGCSDPCCSTDSLPMSLLSLDQTSPGALGLTALAREPNASGAASFRMAVDTGSPLTLFRRRAGAGAAANEGAQLVLRNFDILDAAVAPSGATDVVRGMFRNIEALPVDLGPASSDAVLGGAFLRNFSMQFDFSAPSMTFWSRQGATDGFLASAGFAVLHFNLLGGAELTARSRPDFFGLTGPVEVPATRVVFRACGAPRAFDPVTETQAMNLCCRRGDEVTESTGADLALVLATGIGPLVLSRSAWERIVAAQRPDAPALPAPAGDAPLAVPWLADPVTGVKWSVLPRLALVDQELDDSSNPGACVELGRSRRLEWVEHHQADAACAQPCDTDPREAGKAQNA